MYTSATRSKGGGDGRIDCDPQFRILQTGSYHCSGPSRLARRDCGSNEGVTWCFLPLRMRVRCMHMTAFRAAYCCRLLVANTWSPSTSKAGNLAVARTIRRAVMFWPATALDQENILLIGVVATATSASTALVSRPRSGCRWGIVHCIKTPYVDFRSVLGSFARVPVDILRQCVVYMRQCVVSILERRARESWTTRN